MKTTILKMVIGCGLVIGSLGLKAQDRGGWEFFNFREVQQETPSRDDRQTILPDFHSSRGDDGRSTAFDTLVAQCAAIEGQFGRACDADKVRELLATSVIFEGDATRIEDSLPADGDVVAVANEVLKDAAQDDVKAYVWGLLYEDAKHSKDEMHQLMKDAKTLRMTGFTAALQKSMKLWAAQVKFSETGKSTAPEAEPDEDAIAKKYQSGGHGQTSFASKNKGSSFPGSSCLKAIKWQLPKPGDTGEPPMGPDGKPVSPAEKLSNANIDCTMFDPTMGKKQVSQGEEKLPAQPAQPASTGQTDAQGKTKTGSALASGSAENKEGASKGEQKVEGKVTEKKSSDGKKTHDFKGTATDKKTGKETPIYRNNMTKGDGPAKFFTAKDNAGNEYDVTLDYLSGGLGSMEGVQPKGNAGYANPNDDVVVVNDKQKCENAANTAFKDCLFGFLLEDFENNEKEKYCAEKGYVAGESVGTSKTGGGGKKKYNCNFPDNASAEGADQQQIFMKTGGGWTDPAQQKQYQDSQGQMPGQEGPQQ